MSGTKLLLFFDTETSGLPKRWDAPISDLANWPRLVQISWILCDDTGLEIDRDYQLIRPDGFKIVPGAEEKHGISTEYALRHGVELRPVLERFHQTVAKSSVLVAHNISFDEAVMGSELMRAKFSNNLIAKTQFCTMKVGTELCKIRGKYGFKWPTLLELHEKLFGESFSGSHDAQADCIACMKCFFRMKQLKLFAL